jgi:DNA-directed RNA polymerase specialized sigma24 family protein
MAILASPGAAEEVVQETFLQLRRRGAQAIAERLEPGRRVEAFTA